MAWKTTKKDGTEVTHDIDEKIGAAIADAVDAGVAGVSASIGEAVTAAVTEAIKPVTERLDKVEAGGGGGGGDAGDEGGAGGKGGKGKKHDESPVLAAIGKLTETVTGLVNERNAERTARTTEQLVRGYFDKHLPNLQGRDRLIKRAIAAAPKDEAALKTLVTDFQAEYADVVGKNAAAKAFSADPTKEGAKPPAEGADAQLAEQKERNLKRVREQGPGGFRPVKS